MPSAVRQKFVPSFSQLSLNLFENTLDDSLNLVTLHWHERLEIIHVLEGEGTVTIDFREYSVQKGDLVIVPPSALHSARGRNGLQMTSQTVVFTLECIPPHKEYKPVIHPNMIGYSEMVTLMNFIFETREISNTSKELVLRGYVTALYGLLVYYRNEYEENRHSSAKCQPMKDVISYIQLHYTKKISLDELAHIAGYSKYYFVRYFSEHAGCSCTHYIQTVRLEKAKILLRTTDINISAVSEQVGFESVSYFIKVFKMQEKETPLQYRRRMNI